MGSSTPYPTPSQALAAVRGQKYFFDLPAAGNASFGLPISNTNKYTSFYPSWYTSSWGDWNYIPNFGNFGVSLLVSPQPPPGGGTGPVAWYQLEGNAQDATGNGHNGTINGGVTFAAGRVGTQAAVFNGSDSFVQFPRCVSNDFTIAFWVNTTATASNFQGLVDGKLDGTTDDFQTMLSGNQAAFKVGNPDTTITSVTAINDGQWHHLAAVRLGMTGQMQLFVDGSLEASATGPRGAKAASPNLLIGSSPSGSAGSFFAGAIDDVRIFDRPLTAAEIAALMQ